jgi:hypothetical protein
MPHRGALAHAGSLHPTKSSVRAQERHWIDLNHDALVDREKQRLKRSLVAKVWWRKAAHRFQRTGLHFLTFGVAQTEIEIEKSTERTVMAYARLPEDASIESPYV